jgi:hypothetical protein
MTKKIEKIAVIGLELWGPTAIQAVTVVRGSRL